MDNRGGSRVDCPGEIEATVVAGGRLYLFTLLSDASDAKAIFDAYAATIDLRPATQRGPRARRRRDPIVISDGASSLAIRPWESARAPLPRSPFDGRVDPRLGLAAIRGGAGGIRTPGACALRFSRPPPSTTRPPLRGRG